MAKVKQVRMRLELDPAHPWKETVVYINYDATDRNTENYHRPIPTERFYINLPQVVTDTLGYDKARGIDQDKAMIAFKEALQKFKEYHTEVSRLILYDFEVEPQPNDTSKYFSGHYEVKIWAGTYEETIAIAGDGGRRFSYSPIDSEINFHNYEGNSPMPSSRMDGKQYKNQVLWTKENEVFFLWIKGRMKELIERLNELQTPIQLLETINAGRLLPLGNTDK